LKKSKRERKRKYRAGKKRGGPEEAVGWLRVPRERSIVRDLRKTHADGGNATGRKKLKIHH